jgi:hypothetical protein
MATAVPQIRGHSRSGRASRRRYPHGRDAQVSASRCTATPLCMAPSWATASGKPLVVNHLTVVLDVVAVVSDHSVDAQFPQLRTHSALCGAASQEFQRRRNSSPSSAASCPGVHIDSKRHTPSALWSRGARNPI